MTPRARAARIRFLVLDVDGVLTDGGLWYSSKGETLRRFDVKDGHGLVLARGVGFQVALLSGGSTPAVAARARELRLDFVLQGRPEKAEAFLELCGRAKVAPENTAYMGDDLLDIPAMRLAGFASCPADAVALVRKHAHHVVRSAGGHGAVRELVEFILQASGLWKKAVASRGVDLSAPHERR